MTISKDMLTDMVLHNPLTLLLVRDQNDINYINDLLPYSTGIEIDCDRLSRYNHNDFLNIPTIIEAPGSVGEQRYRIPNGINGIMCLYCISIQLKINLALNHGSGIHYHNDFTDVIINKYGDIEEAARVDEIYILSELDKWGYTGSYNHRNYNGWYRHNGLGTMEYRVGNMTFDYEILVKQILHTNELSRLIKTHLNVKPVEYQEYQREVFVDYIINLGSKPYKNPGKLHHERKINTPVDIGEIVNNRITKI